ncbi:major facilitator superfamily domain-containing protein [Podospora australis]|uniref:Major facilitator superfamily domain-containing protein n=1 Tax=Podospora australis TaxID=1536484 RepID=A0AAN7AEK3_9PEZI|nr:major facilitator superfamily domain-containing protein [Podospora australis]
MAEMDNTRSPPLDNFGRQGQPSIEKAKTKEPPPSGSDTPTTSSSSDEDVQDVETASISTPPPTTSWRGKAHRIWSWQPPPSRYDPANPPKFTVWLNILFGFAGCFTVSNLYYNQAILNRIALTFSVSFETASSVATLMQAGYAGGLLFLCPLGDILPRRPFILSLVFLTAALWIILCLTTSFAVFAAISFIVGFTTVTPQLMLPLVGDLAPPHRRASSLAIVISGLALGVLVARILSGILASFTPDWRNIYWFGLGVQILVFLSLYIWMPSYPSSNPSTKLSSFSAYPRILYTILHLLLTEPTLAQASLVAFCLSAVFTSFWTTLSFLLSSPPYSYTSLVIGLFGLIGIVIIFSAPIYSRLVIDRINPISSALLGIAVELAGVAIGTFTGTKTVAGPIVQAIAIDLGNQFTQIALRASIYGIQGQANARNRVNTAYMVVSFSGQLTGTAVGNRLYAQGGWVYSGSCSIALIGLAMVACLVRGPRETGWLGWSGGWALKRDDLPPKKSDEEVVTEKSSSESVTESGHNQSQTRTPQ